MPAPLRFRVWHDGQMHGPDGLMLGNGDAFLVVPPSVMDLPYRLLDDGVVMQSTGLTDADGREIYEGDILASPAGTTIRVWWSHDRLQFMGVQTSGGKVERIGNLGYYAPRSCRIVGNIHEHPHLVQG